MPVNVSDRLRIALEQLDEAIDRLDARVSRHLEESKHPETAAGPSPDRMIAERLDRIIERIELALAE